MADNQRDQQRGGHGNHNRNHDNRHETPIDASNVSFGKSLSTDLFNGIAKNHASKIGLQENGYPRNEKKPTQLRRFYDEIVLWETRTSQHPAKFQEYLPFIRMINAKVAYAEGRRLVNSDFVNLMQHTLKQVNDAETMTHCKLFWEAFMGFYKQVHPKD